MVTAPDDLTAGALPWCQAGHETDWVDGCPACQTARGIVEAVEEHSRAFGCQTYPVCIDHPGGPCDAVAGVDGLDA